MTFNLQARQSCSVGRRGRTWVRIPRMRQLLTGRDTIFATFSKNLPRKSELDVIHVVAHSMGNRIAMRALETLRRKGRGPKKTRSA